MAQDTSQDHNHRDGEQDPVEKLGIPMDHLDRNLRHLELIVQLQLEVVDLQADS